MDPTEEYLKEIESLRLHVKELEFDKSDLGIQLRHAVEDAKMFGEQVAKLQNFVGILLKQHFVNETKKVFVPRVIHFPEAQNK